MQRERCTHTHTEMERDDWREINWRARERAREPGLLFGGAKPRWVEQLADICTVHVDGVAACRCFLIRLAPVSEFAHELRQEVQKYFEKEAKRRGVPLMQAIKATPARWALMLTWAAIFVATLPSFFAGEYWTLIGTPFTYVNQFLFRGFTENLLENTDGVLRTPSNPLPLPRGGGLLRLCMLTA